MNRRVMAFTRRESQRFVAVVGSTAHTSSNRHDVFADRGVMRRLEAGEFYSGETSPLRRAQL